MSIAQSVAGYDREARSGIYTSGMRDSDKRKGGNMTLAYPRRGLEAFDPKDELMRVKMELVKEGKVTGMTKFGLVTVTDEDLKWLERKRDTEAKANFDKWIGSNFNTNDVVTRQWLQKTYPEYHDAREQTMIDRAKFALRVNLLMMRGPKNQKDLVLYWGLQQGLIKLDRGWDKIGMGVEAPVEKDEQERFRNGLMNPWRYKSDEERKSNMKAPNPFSPDNDLSGGGGGVPGFYGNIVPKEDRYTSFYNTVLRGSLFNRDDSTNDNVDLMDVGN